MDLCLKEPVQDDTAPDLDTVVEINDVAEEAKEMSWNVPSKQIAIIANIPGNRVGMCY